MNEKQLIEKFLKRKGWFQFYNDNYWVHEKTVAEPDKMDPTKYGMDLASAFIHEVENFPPFLYYETPDLSRHLYVLDRELIEYYLGKKL